MPVLPDKVKVLASFAIVVAGFLWAVVSDWSSIANFFSAFMSLKVRTIIAVAVLVTYSWLLPRLLQDIKNGHKI